MSEQIIRVANERGVWLMAIPMVVIVVVQALLYCRLAFRAADKIGFPREKCWRGFRAGAITAIGPCLAIFIVMMGMMAVIGAPITWLRLSVIGAAPTELTAATVGAQAYGVEFGSPKYDMMALATSWWTMAINGVGWLLLVAIIGKYLEGMREKMGGGDPAWLAVISGAAMLGCFAYLNSSSILAGGPRLVAAVTGGVSMVIFLNIAKRATWLREYCLGIAMIIGIVAAAMM